MYEHVHLVDTGASLMQFLLIVEHISVERPFSFSCHVWYLPVHSCCAKQEGK